MEDRLLKFMVTFGGTVVAYEWLTEEGAWKCEKLNARITDIVPDSLHEKLKRWQFTGEQDSNGVDLYEGHKILPFINDKREEGTPYEVRYIEHAFWMIDPDNGEPTSMDCIWYGDYEIVGHVDIVKGRELKIEIKTHKKGE